MNEASSFVEKVNMNDNKGETDDGKRKVITLLEAFEYVERVDYPELWRTEIMTMTMFTTTVSCEQYFSQLRNKFHENMKIDTALVFLSASQKRRTFNY